MQRHQQLKLFNTSLEYIKNRLPLDDVDVKWNLRVVQKFVSQILEDYIKQIKRINQLQDEVYDYQYYLDTISDESGDGLDVLQELNERILENSQDIPEWVEKLRRILERIQSESTI